MFSQTFTASSFPLPLISEEQEESVNSSSQVSSESNRFLTSVHSDPSWTAVLEPA